MSGLSRREFLKTLGISAAATAAPLGALHALSTGEGSGAQPALWGRALVAAPVRDSLGRVVRTLLPDEISPLRPLSASLVQLPTGRADRRCLQPIARPATAWDLPLTPGWVQVAAPYATLRAWCAADARLIARPGWGAVLFAVDRLNVDEMDWLAVRVNEALIWSPASAWRSIPDAGLAGEASDLVVDRAAQRVHVRQRGVDVWSAEAAVPRDLLPGTYSLLDRAPTDSAAQAGAPWLLDFGAWRMHGAYWHNSFGDAAYAAPSGVIELPVLAAQAFYALSITTAQVVAAGV